MVEPWFHREGTVGEGDAGLVGKFALHTAEWKVCEMGSAGGSEVGLAVPDLILWFLGEGGEGFWFKKSW
jgi:hypothetical protein